MPKTRAPGKLTGETLNGFPIRRIAVKRIRAAAYNPREISDKALTGLGASVKEFGLVTPIIWNKRTQRVVGGHQRLKTLDKDSETEVIEVDLSLEREKALNLALNNPHTSGGWTVDLANVLSDVDNAFPELCFDLNFQDLHDEIPSDVDALLEEITSEPTGASTTPPKNETPEPKQTKGEWKQGDVKQIVLVVDPQEYAEATSIMNDIQKRQGLDSQTAAVLWLLRNHDKIR